MYAIILPPHPNVYVHPSYACCICGQPATEGMIDPPHVYCAACALAKLEQEKASKE